MERSAPRFSVGRLGEAARDNELMSAFNETQQMALEKAYSDLGEHFSGVLVAVMANVDDRNDEVTKVYYYGGRMQALGLAVEAKRAIQCEKAHEPDV